MLYDIYMFNFVILILIYLFFYFFGRGLFLIALELQTGFQCKGKDNLEKVMNINKIYI